jgi:23S rRNA (guanosine2251-2'-O)-methyltransferase
MSRRSDTSGSPRSGRRGGSGAARRGPGGSKPDRAGDRRTDRSGARADSREPQENREPWKSGRGSGQRPTGQKFAGQKPGGQRRGRSGHGGGQAVDNMLWGYHTVREALRSPRRTIHTLYATQAAAERLADEIAARNIEPAVVDPAELDRLLPAGAVHQGMAARVAPLPELDISELPGDGFVLVLDQVTDPHNLGAIIRSAAAFAISAVIMTERNAPPLAGVVAKSASGGLEHAPVITVVNLARALEELGDMGYWRIGLDSDGEASLEHTRLERPLALVLGAEGKGLRRLTRENCDVVARLDMPGAIRSLNVSNACAVALSIASLANRTAAR